MYCYFCERDSVELNQRVTITSESTLEFISIWYQYSGTLPCRRCIQYARQRKDERTTSVDNWIIDKLKRRIWSNKFSRHEIIRANNHRSSIKNRDKIIEKATIKRAENKDELNRVARERNANDDEYRKKGIESSHKSKIKCAKTISKNAKKKWKNRTPEEIEATKKRVHIYGKNLTEEQRKAKAKSNKAWYEKNKDEINKRDREKRKIKKEKANGNN